MRKALLCIILFLPFIVHSQSNTYFQQKVDYDIEVKLNIPQKSLDGFVSINYINNSPDTLRYIWFHLWPNAYKNDQTAFSEQLLQLGNTDFYFSNEEKKGYINKLNFTVNGTSAVLEDHPQYIDVARLRLPAPLSPHGQIHIETPFHVKLPYLFSRSGYAENFFSIAQWYPKPAVYDRYGWHEMPYLQYGEFYSEFGNYTVSITLPENYQLAATGVKDKEKMEEGQRTVTYTQQNIHDFAWFASTNFRADSTTCLSIDGHEIRIFSYYLKDHADAWKNSIQYIRETIEQREEAVGPYPYTTITVVEAPELSFEGMEYPTIALIKPTRNPKLIAELINHEVGHNWFYSTLANNERAYAWMDEGINSFYTQQYIHQKFGAPVKAIREDFFSGRMNKNHAKFSFDYMAGRKMDQPIDLPSDQFSTDNYYLSMYYKAPVWVGRLEKMLGNEKFSAAIHTYYNTWKNKHPSPLDFKNAVEKSSGQNSDSMFALLNQRGSIEPPVKRQFKLSSFYDFRETDKYNYLFAGPAAGFNYYDGLMLGGFLHNYNIPEPPFHFFAAPVYGLRSKKLNGIGRIGYSKTSYGKIRKFEIALAASKFDMHDFVDSTGKRNFMDFVKIVPSARLTFRNKSPMKQATTYLQWKTYFFREASLLFTRDTIHDVNVITYPKNNRYLNELLLAHQNFRVLYPFSYQLKAQQGDGFIRLAMDVRQHFNYTNGLGLNARFFGGKLLYTTNNPHYLYGRYQFNMTGPDGEEDYTYADYFVGRNRFDGIWSQQIMVADGGFKIRTDLLNNKVGTSGDWIAALNLDTDIPNSFNPLQMIPGIRLKAFADIGTYAESWKQDAGTGKFLFDAGLQLNIAGDLVKVYIPILYSKVYRDYYKSTVPKEKRFWKTISFTIDIQSFSLKKMLDLPN